MCYHPLKQERFFCQAVTQYYKVFTLIVKQSSNLNPILLVLIGLTHLVCNCGLHIPCTQFYQTCGLHVHSITGKTLSCVPATRMPHASLLPPCLFPPTQDFSCFPTSSGILGNSQSGLISGILSFQESSIKGVSHMAHKLLRLVFSPVSIIPFSFT